MKDFRAAVAWARAEGFAGPMTLWGSSYSSGRMFHLLVESPDEFVAAIAFSPGAAFAFPPEDGGLSLAERIASADKILFVQNRGTHGSSTLNPERNRFDSEGTWVQVLRFLDAHARMAGPATGL